MARDFGTAIQAFPLNRTPLNRDHDCILVQTVAPSPARVRFAGSLAFQTLRFREEEHDNWQEQ